jgi:MFS family permease
MQSRVQASVWPLQLVKPSPPAEGLSPLARHQAFIIILRDTFYSQTVQTLTTGIFLTGFALEYHASNQMIGLLVATPSLAQLFQLPGVYLLQKLQAKRQITLITTLLSRLFLLPMALSPCLHSTGWGLRVLCLSYLLYASIGAVATCAWNAWLKDVLPRESLGAFFSRKLTLSSLVSIFLLLSAWIVLSTCRPMLASWQSLAYGVLFLIAFGVGLLGVPHLRDMPEAPPPATNRPTASLFRQLGKPLADRSYFKLLQFLFTWNFAINLATPFFSVYWLRVLHLPMLGVILLSVLTQVVNCFCLPILGKLADRAGNKAVLAISMPTLLLCLTLWIVSISTGHSLNILPLIFAIHILLGIINAGTTLTNSNFGLKLSPSENAAAYLAMTTVTTSLAAGISPLLAGWLIDTGKHWHGTWQISLPMLPQMPLHWNAWTLVFGSAFLLAFVALKHLKKLPEISILQSKSDVLTPLSKRASETASRESTLGTRAI